MSSQLSKPNLANKHARARRDTDKVFEAVLEARKRTDEGNERALQLLMDSQTDIKKIVRPRSPYRLTEANYLGSRLLCGDSISK
jgi:hypothetical protein